jgi:hypothetical protein
LADLTEKVVALFVSAFSGLRIATIDRADQTIVAFVAVSTCLIFALAFMIYVHVRAAGEAFVRIRVAVSAAHRIVNLRAYAGLANTWTPTGIGALRERDAGSAVNAIIVVPASRRAFSIRDYADSVASCVALSTIIGDSIGAANGIRHDAHEVTWRRAVTVSADKTVVAILVAEAFGLARPLVFNLNMSAQRLAFVAVRKAIDAANRRVDVRAHAVRAEFGAAAVIGALDGLTNRSGVAVFINLARRGTRAFEENFNAITEGASLAWIGLTIGATNRVAR